MERITIKEWKVGVGVGVGVGVDIDCACVLWCGAWCEVVRSEV